MHRTIHIVAFVLLAGRILAQIPNDLDVDGLEKKLQTVPGLEGFNSSSLPDQEDVERLVKEKCEKNGGGEEAFNALKNQQGALQECLEQHLNVTVIQEEIETSKQTGSMDEVFGKYCKKYPQIYECVEAVTDKIRPCLDDEEQKTLNQTLKIVEELKEFLCFKDGDRIAMFIAEGGVECMESRKEDLQRCANKTIGSRIPTDFSIESLPMFLFTNRECQDFENVRKCFNEELEKCRDSTPANIIDAFFKFLKKHLPCDFTSEAVSEQKLRNSASATFVSSLVLGFVLVVSRFL